MQSQQVQVTNNIMSTEEIEDTQTKFDLDKVEEEKPVSPYKKAIGIPLFDDNGNELENYKGIVNEALETEVFSVTSKGYKIVQHEEVLTEVEDIVNQLQLKHDRRVVQMNNGARIHAGYSFPEISFVVDGKAISLNVSWENSYDQTTGVRMTVGAYNGSTKTMLYLGEKFSRYYHKHTQGLDTNGLIKNLKKGIDAFENKVKSYFDDMVNKQWTKAEVLMMIDESVEEKLLASKYADIIKDTISKEIDFNLKSTKVISQWNLYLMISEVLDKNVVSMDARNRYSALLQNRMNKK